MAALTASAVRNGSLGSFRLIVATFSTMDDGDTWASGLDREPVFKFWFQEQSNPSTQGSVGVAATRSGGTFTFHPAENSKTNVDLFILIGSGS